MKKLNAKTVCGNVALLVGCRGLKLLKDENEVKNGKQGKYKGEIEVFHNRKINKNVLEMFPFIESREVKE